MTTDQQRLHAALIKMTHHFKSSQFAAECRLQGISDEFISRGRCANFLHKNAIQSKDSNYEWTKKESHSEDIFHYLGVDKLQDAIKLLKQSGYRVMKQVSEWQEI